MRRFALFLTIAAIVGGTSLTLACPFCSAPSLTLSEQVDASDEVVLVKWLSARKAEANSSSDSDQNAEIGIPGRAKGKTTPAKTVFEVAETIRSKSGLKVGQKVELPQYREAEQGDLFVLLGTETPVGKTVEWGTPLEVDEASFGYLKYAPDAKAPTQQRLKYYVKYLEFPDELVANDAYAEFANAPYEDIAAIQESFPKERIRNWVSNPETNVTRLGLYGLMLGLCGDESDAKLMKDKITEETKDFRLGIDGVMSGYLLLTTDDGLKVLEDTKLKAGVKCPFSETYAAMQAVRFMWTYGDGVISKDRLKESMRVLLDRPELADLVITDLARWKDWSVQDRLMELYGTEGYEIPAVKRAIVRYMLVSQKTSEEDDSQPEHVVKGKRYLDQLRERDPGIVKQAERFLIVK
ncbi:hypothetical protein [Thalassoroseus pseudoceratinae]|uniref:hypothetical protein n=1 Tax=Thalassoroseus pseudoceratinae TaxID=2713176 RepID=UPI00142068C1|nr:hypothetical protein [Thalassoroseus pseudoceratinae]